MLANESVAPRQSTDTIYSGFWHRFLAMLIDYIVVTIISAIVHGFIFMFTNIEQHSGHFVAFFATIAFFFSQFSFGHLFFIFVVSLIYFVILESLLFTTVGKLYFQLKVTDLSGNRISLKSALIRFFCKFVAVFLLLFASIRLIYSTGTILNILVHIWYDRPINHLLFGTLHGWQVIIFLFILCLLLISILGVFFSKKKQGFHDRVAGTVVIVNQKMKREKQLI